MPIKDSMFAGQGGGEDKPTPAEEPAKPKRRTKEQLIADAVIPGPTDIVKVEFTASSTKGDREWQKAVELFREGKVKFVDGSLRYAVLKLDQQAAEDGAGDSEVVEKIATATARWLDLQQRIDAATEDEEVRTLSEESEQVRDEINQLGGQDPASEEAYANRDFTPGALVGKRGPEYVPENAMTGDEIITGSKADKTEETYYVGYGHVLMKDPPTHEDVPVMAGARWVREGENDWRSYELIDGDESEDEPDVPATIGEGIAKSGAGEPLKVDRETVAPVAEQVGGVQLGLWKVSMGYLEKIGLPDYSSLQIGPCSAQTHVLDDGRRTKAVMHGRDVEVPTAVVEMLQQCGQVAELAMRAERQAMINFLEAVKPGSTKPQ